MIKVDEIHNLLPLDQAALDVYQWIVDGPHKGCVCILSYMGDDAFMLTILGEGIEPIIQAQAIHQLQQYQVRPLKAKDSFTITLEK